MWDSKCSVIIDRPVGLTNIFMITSSDGIPAPVALTGDMDIVQDTAPGPANWNPTKDSMTYPKS
ncbi:hypothetical protein VE00_03466 [Pseudogymnoascus sp. WSF 3629]|nr:hypothetical protein VE00_03466 [Pseudogymnoascus sp. WSF 3629]